MNKPIPAVIAALFLSIIAGNAAFAAKAPAAPAPKYIVTDGAMVATFEVPVTGKIAAWKLHFEFKTQCENDHRIVLTSPSGRSIGLMERGLKRCSGRSAVFTSDNSDGGFAGSAAGGIWTVRFQDLDDNKYTGVLTKFRMEMLITAGGDTTKYVVNLKGLPKKMPQP